MNIIINPEYSYLESYIKELPNSFKSEGKSIYKGRNELKVFEINDKKILVKSFKIPHIINKIAYSFFRPSKAKRSYLYGLEIIKRGINTPMPIAYIEEFKCGLLNRSFYVSEYCEYKRSFREFDLRPGTFEKKTDILIAFADYTAQMHDASIYHLDYSNGNILFEKQSDLIHFSIVDVNRIAWGNIGEEKSYQSFHRLCAGEEMLRIIAEQYALKRNLNVEKCIQKVKYYNDKTMKPTPLDQWPPLEDKNTYEK